MTLWRQGRMFGIHVYEDDRPVATFTTEDDAMLAVSAVNVLAAVLNVVSTAKIQPEPELSVAPVISIVSPPGSVTGTYGWQPPLPLMWDVTPKC